MAVHAQRRQDSSRDHVEGWNLVVRRLATEQGPALQLCPSWTLHFPALSPPRGASSHQERACEAGPTDAARTRKLPGACLPRERAAIAHHILKRSPARGGLLGAALSPAQPPRRAPAERCSVVNTRHARLPTTSSCRGNPAEAHALPGHPLAAGQHLRAARPGPCSGQRELGQSPVGESSVRPLSGAHTFTPRLHSTDLL